MSTLNSSATDNSNPYYAGLNHNLLSCVPNHVTRVLELGCSSGQLGSALKRRQACFVAGVEMHQESAALAKKHLDVVYQTNIENLLLQFEEVAPEPFDCLIVGDVFEHLTNPTETLSRLHQYLSNNAIVCTSIPNFAHHSVLRALMTDNFQYHDMGLLDRTHIHMFSQTSVLKMFLDAGFMPQLHSYVHSEVPADFGQILQQFAAVEKMDASKALFNASIYQYIFVASKLANPLYTPVPDRIDLVCAVNNDLQLQNNLLVSPLLKQHPHQIHAFQGASSIAATLEAAKPKLQGDWLILAHQDVYLPVGWFERVIASWQAIENKFGPVGVAGVFGKATSLQNNNFNRFGRVLNYNQTLDTGADVAMLADSLDELVLVFKREHLPTLNPTLGFHLYGTEVCHWAKQQGLHSIIVDAPCLHNTNTNPGNVSSDLLTSAKRYLEIYQPSLPLTSTSLHISEQGEIRVI